MAVGHTNPQVGAVEMCIRDRPFTQLRLRIESSLTLPPSLEMPIDEAYELSLIHIFPGQPARTCLNLYPSPIEANMCPQFAPGPI